MLMKISYKNTDSDSGNHCACTLFSINTLIYKIQIDGYHGVVRRWRQSFDSRYLCCSTSLTIMRLRVNSQTSTPFTQVRLFGERTWDWEGEKTNNDMTQLMLRPWMPGLPVVLTCHCCTSLTLSPTSTTRQVPTRLALPVAFLLHSSKRRPPESRHKRLQAPVEHDICQPTDAQEAQLSVPPPPVPCHLSIKPHLGEWGRSSTIHAQSYDC